MIRPITRDGGVAHATFSRQPHSRPDGRPPDPYCDGFAGTPLSIPALWCAQRCAESGVQAYDLQEAARQAERQAPRQQQPIEAQSQGGTARAF